MSERITTERAREIAGRDHGAHCRHCADSIALAADLLDARASLAAERTRREAAEARLAAIVASTARDLDALRAVRHLDEEHGREIAEAIDRAEDGGSHALHLVAALGRAAELRGMLRAVAAAVGCESWHDAATVAADTRARLAAIVGAVRTEREARDAVPEGFDADHAGADERARVCALWDAADAATKHLDALLAGAPAPAVVPADVVRARLDADDVLVLAEQLRDESTRLARATHARRRTRYGRWALGWGRARWGVALYRRAVCLPVGGSVRSGWELGCADGPGRSGSGRCVPLYDDAGYCARLGQVRAGGPR